MKINIVPLVIYLSFAVLAMPSHALELSKDTLHPEERPRASAQSAHAAANDGASLKEIAKRLADAVTSLKAGTPPAPAGRDKSVQNADGQSETGSELKVDPVNGVVRELKARSGRTLHKAGAGASPETTARSFLRSNRNLLKIASPDDEFTLASDKSDATGLRHLRFNQHYRGIPVWPSQVIVHLNTGGDVYLMDGAYVPTPKDAVVPTTALGQEDAIALARKTAPDSGTGKVTSSELIYYAAKDRIAKLAWKIELDISITSNWLVVIDADSGATLAAYNRVMFGGVQGSGIDLMGKTRTLNVYQDTSGFCMFDTSKPMFDSARSSGYITIFDFNKSWNPDPPNVACSGSSNSSWPPDAVSASYNLSKTYDYFKQRFGWDSVDNNKGDFSAYVRTPKTASDGAPVSEAFWNPHIQAMYFVDGPYAAGLDIVAHELTHGISGHSAKFENQNESGALSEAFSDIFGIGAYKAVTSASSWVMGSSINFPIRNLKDPHDLNTANECGQISFSHPAKLSEYVKSPNNPDGDNGGIHCNSTIVSHAFYLLAEGLPNAIGIQDAEKIFFQALTHHLGPQSNFIDTRQKVITSAEELFGRGSVQAQKAAAAFDAVEIYDGSQSQPRTPSPIPVVAADDSLLFITKTPNTNTLRLARHETAQGDAANGTWLSTWSVNFERPSVSAGGQLAAYIAFDNDLCIIGTDGTDEFCLNLPGLFKSAALSSAADKVALVLRDVNGQPYNEIGIINLANKDMQTIRLTGTATDGGTAAIDYADSLAFSFDGDMLFYDAAAQVPDGTGKTSEVWSLFLVNLRTGVTGNPFPPIPGFHLGNPSVSHKYPNLLAFDGYDVEAQQGYVFVYDLFSGQVSEVGKTGNALGFPSFTGDDAAIVYAAYDATATRTYSSLMKQALGGNDFMTPQGSPSKFAPDANMGVMYRRGAFLSGTTVVEYYHAGLDHYFVTSDPNEQKSVDSGAAGAWRRTGNTFKAGGPDLACRFYGNTGKEIATGRQYGPNSHFYTADRDECGSLIWQSNPYAKSWFFESYDFSTTQATNGACPSNLIPVYRAYNNGYSRGIDSNHRITSDYTSYVNTVNRGWKGEGVVMCAPR